MKVWKAVGKIYGFHLLFVLISTFMIGPLYGFADKMPVLFCGATSFAYGCAMYAIGWNLGRLDSRKIPGYYPTPAFPVKVSAICAVVPVILLILCFGFPDIWQINWGLFHGEYDFFFTGNRLRGTTDFIYKLWYFPFGIFLGNGRIATYLLAIFVQPVLVIAGYFVGLTRFKVLDMLLPKIIYKKK